MRKSILFISALLILSACGNSQQKQEKTDTADSPMVDSTNGETQSATPSYHFEYQLVKGDDGDFQSIVVKGYLDEQNCTFECRHDLVASVSEESAADTQWINDTEDINFDGHPDLQIFLWHTVVGQVIKSYAAYIMTPQHQFEEVKQWIDLCNPEIHPDIKTVTANYRSDINERTFDTYQWTTDNTLELIDTRKEPLFEE